MKGPRIVTTHRLTLICAARSATVAFPDNDAVDEEALAKIASARLRFGLADRVWTGPDAMTRRTAGLAFPEAVVEPALAEIDYGAWRGRTLDEAAAADSSGLQAWTSDPAAAPHGGETIVALVARVGRWLESLLTLSGRSVAVAPTSVLKAAVVSVLGAPASSFSRVDIKPMRTAMFVSDGRRWTLRSFGEVLGDGGSCLEE